MIAEAIASGRLAGQVDTVVTLGAPFGGSPWARLFPFAAITRALRGDSPLLRRIACAPLPAGVRRLAFTATLDMIVPACGRCPPLRSGDRNGRRCRPSRDAPEPTGCRSHSRRVGSLGWAAEGELPGLAVATGGRGVELDPSNSPAAYIRGRPDDNVAATMPTAKRSSGRRWYAARMPQHRRQRKVRSALPISATEVHEKISSERGRPAGQTTDGAHHERQPEEVSHLPTARSRCRRSTGTTDIRCGTIPNARRPLQVAFGKPESSAVIANGADLSGH